MLHIESALLTPPASQNQCRSRPTSSAGEILLLGALLCSLQIADGILTAIGVIRFGTSIEGNLLLRCLMDSYGVVGTLVGVKGVCIGIVLSLCCIADSLPWLHAALRGLASLYLCAAIIPWIYILLQQSL